MVKTKFTDLAERRNHQQRLGLSFERMEVEVEEHWIASQQSAHMSVNDIGYTIQTVVEQQCINLRSGRLIRCSELTPIITVSVTAASHGEQYLDFSELRKACFKDQIHANEEGRSSCPYCSGAHPGSLVHVRKRVANEPEFILVSIDRSINEGGQQTINTKRLQNHWEFDMKDWTRNVFSDPEDRRPSSLKYRLVDVSLYGPHPRHSVDFVRLPKSATELSGEKPEIRRGRLNDGNWIKFDSRCPRPEWQSPDMFMESGYYESRLIFQKDETSQEEDPSTSKLNTSGASLNQSIRAAQDATRNAHNAARNTADSEKNSEVADYLNKYREDL